MATATYRIEQVFGPTPWSNDKGTFHEYRLRLSGVQKAVSVNYKPDGPKPAEGQDILLEVTPHPRFDDILRGKRVQAQRPGGPSGGRSPEERRSIERQCSLKSAVEFHSGRQASAQDVVTTAQVFVDWLVQP